MEIESTVLPLDGTVDVQGIAQPIVGGAPEGTEGVLVIRMRECSVCALYKLWGRGRKGESERVCVCVCVCERERERERERIRKQQALPCLELFCTQRM